MHADPGRSQWAADRSGAPGDGFIGCDALRGSFRGQASAQTERRPAFVPCARARRGTQLRPPPPNAKGSAPDVPAHRSSLRDLPSCLRQTIAECAAFLSGQPPEPGGNAGVAGQRRDAPGRRSTADRARASRPPGTAGRHATCAPSLPRSLRSSPRHPYPMERRRPGFPQAMQPPGGQMRLAASTLRTPSNKPVRRAADAPAQVRRQDVRRRAETSLAAA